MADSDWLSKMALKHAEVLASAGKYEQADQILRDVHAQDRNTRTHSQTLSQSVRASLTTQLNERFPNREHLPRRRVAMSALKDYGLRSFDAYIFSLLDGGTSIDDLVTIAPASELETLTSLRKLSDLQLIDVDPC
jgi:hypothetical protein